MAAEQREKQGLQQPVRPELRNLGPKSLQMLAAAGIHDLHQLRALGAVVAYARVQDCGAGPSLNLLWALEGALTGLPWQQVAREHRTSLLLALQEHRTRLADRGHLR